MKDVYTSKTCRHGKVKQKAAVLYYHGKVTSGNAGMHSNCMSISAADAAAPLQLPEWTPALHESAQAHHLVPAQECLDNKQKAQQRHHSLHMHMLMAYSMTGSM